MRFVSSVLLAGLLFCAGLAEAATVSVEMRNNFFQPATVNINVGDTVTWVQRGSNHDTVSTTGLWSSGILSPGQTFSHTFNTPGTFGYFCTPHRSAGMVGTVNVAGAPNTPPTVAVTAPNNGGTFLTTDTITFSAIAADNGSVTKVEFFADGTKIGEDASAPYSVTGTLAAGTHSITARATDNEGAASTSSAVSITVNAANQPPTVTLTAPADGATFQATDTITFSADAGDDGSVSKVDFFAGENLIGTDTDAPYSVTGTLAAGSHSITARATDNTGATATSIAVSITVQAAANQPPVVTLVDPLGGFFEAPESILLRATASDSDGTIAQVEFFNGTTSLGVDTTEPFELAQNDLGAAVYTFSAVATDNAGARTTSEVRTVYVAAQPRITSLARTAGNNTINVEGTTGVPHVLEGSLNLLTWASIVTNTPVSGTTVFNDSSSESSKFYRVVVR